MTYSQLKKIIHESGLSPEQLASRLGVSNMTLRRWSREPGGNDLPVANARALVEGIYQLISEGHLDPKSPAVHEILEQSPSLSFGAVLSDMGIVSHEMEPEQSCKEKMTMALFQIGSSKEHRAEVDNGEKRLQWFKKLGSDWKSHITTLVRIVRDKNISHVEKLVAYGALFYLVSPFDLIPDSLPFAGVIDDYSFLILATAYYAAKFPKVIPTLVEPELGIKSTPGD